MSSTRGAGVSADSRSGHFARAERKVLAAALEVYTQIAGTDLGIAAISGEEFDLAGRLQRELQPAESDDA